MRLHGDFHRAGRRHTENPLQLITISSRRTISFGVGLRLGTARVARQHQGHGGQAFGAKKLFNVWQRAEQTYKEKRLRLVFAFANHSSHRRAHGEDQRPRPNHRGQLFNPPRKAGQAIVTGMGCDNVDYKINFMSRSCATPNRGPEQSGAAVRLRRRRHGIRPRRA